MLLLAFIAHLAPFRTHRPAHAAVRMHAAVGHFGLTIIALVYVLIVLWQN
jgi:hypothetical protein